MTYNQFAEVYDKLMEEAPYDDWVALTESILHDRSISSEASILDLGCGTGEIAVRLSLRGYHITGVDYSSEMLAIAQQKADQHQASIQWIRQDMRELEGFKDIDICISYCDVMNYIVKEQDILQVCERAADCLQDQGIFIFDVHDADYAVEALSGHTFAEVNEDISYIWDCYEGEKEGNLLHDITFFRKTKSGLYEKFTELHEQQVCKLDVYERNLKKAGFNKITFFNDFQYEYPVLQNNRMRNFIIAEK